MSKRRIWIDVTDFLKWQGSFTGFQHIQYNMAKQFLADGRDVDFFVYDEPAHAFKQIDFDPDEASKDGIIVAAETIRPAPSKPLLNTIKQYAPAPLKRVVKRLLKSKQALPKIPTPSARSPFATGDLVLVLGGIWHGSFADDMTLEKKHKNFLLVHIVHDMIPVRVPGFVVEDLPAVFATYKEKIFKIADGLIINSKSSQRDALNFMNEKRIAPPPSMVFRIADEPVDGKETPIKNLEPNQFILSMGTIEGRKNHALLYYVYKQAVRQGITLPTLVIAGRIGWLTDDIRYVISHDLDTKDKIRIVTNVTNSERAWLYRHCLFTVWPSFYEGWGMPVAESAAYNKLCLSSDTASMKEIAGSLNEYFSPYDPLACLKLINKYLDNDVRKAREQQIKKDYRPTTWHDMYAQIVAFLDKL